MASKKIVVDLDLSGNRINNALVQLLTKQEVSRDTATMAKGAGQLGFYNGKLYRSVLKTSNPDTYQWKALATAEELSQLAQEVSEVSQDVERFDTFRDNYSHVTGAIESEVVETLEMDYNSNTKRLFLSWGAVGMPHCSVDMGQFLIDGMLSGAHVVEYEYIGVGSAGYSVDGEPITIGTTEVDGKIVTNDESGFPTPATVTKDGKYLRLVFNTEPADTKTAAWVDVSSLADIYTAGNGISISSNAISVHLKQNQGLGVDANGLYVKVDGTSVTFDNQGRLTASANIYRTSGRVPISEGSADFSGPESKRVISARLTDYDGNEIICEKTIADAEVEFAWNVGDYVAPSTLTNADYYYYEIFRA